MGYSKYTEDNNDIWQERYSDYIDRKRVNEEIEWRRLADSARNQEKLSVLLHSQEEDTSRVQELMTLRDNLSFQINLVLCVTNSMKSTTVINIARTLVMEIETAYTNVSNSISFMNTKGVHVKSHIEKEHLKRNLIRIICLRSIQTINNVQIVSLTDLNLIIMDLKTLIRWYYESPFILGKISYGNVNSKINEFFEEELGLSFRKCPYCGKDTLKELRFCMLCSKEWYYE